MTMKSNICGPSIDSLVNWFQPEVESKADTQEAKEKTRYYHENYPEKKYNQKDKEFSSPKAGVGKEINNQKFNDIPSPTKDFPYSAQKGWIGVKIDTTRGVHGPDGGKLQERQRGKSDQIIKADYRQGDFLENSMRIEIDPASGYCGKESYIASEKEHKVDCKPIAPGVHRAKHKQEGGGFRAETKRLQQPGRSSGQDFFMGCGSPEMEKSTPNKTVSGSRDHIAEPVYMGSVSSTQAPKQDWKRTKPGSRSSTRAGAGRFTTGSFEKQAGFGQKAVLQPGLVVRPTSMTKELASVPAASVSSALARAEKAADGSEKALEPESMGKCASLCESPGASNADLQDMQQSPKAFGTVQLCVEARNLTPGTLLRDAHVSFGETHIWLRVTDRAGQTWTFRSSPFAGPIHADQCRFRLDETGKHVTITLQKASADPWPMIELWDEHDSEEEN